jgi:hypothetical protein
MITVQLIFLIEKDLQLKHLIKASDYDSKIFSYLNGKDITKRITFMVKTLIKKDGLLENINDYITQLSG